ncbi:hypothetical protein V8F06_001035 [Rhypophila decipiens]
MVAPASLAASLTAAAALLILSPNRAFALPTGAASAEDALSVRRGLFDPPTSKNIYEYHAGTDNGHSTFSGSLKKDDWLAGKDTRKEMDKMFPHRFDSPQKPTPYDEYDGGPVVVERRDTVAAVVEKRGSILGSIWQAMTEGVEVPLGKNHSLGFKLRIPGLKEAIKYWKMKTEVDKMSLPIMNMQEDSTEAGAGGRRKGWVDRYSGNGNKKREETVTETPTAVTATATGYDDARITGTHVIFVDEGVNPPETWQIQNNRVTVVTGVWREPTPAVVLTPAAEPEVEATPTPTPQVTGGGCGHH